MNRHRRGNLIPKQHRERMRWAIKDRMFLTVRGRHLSAKARALFRSIIIIANSQATVEGARAVDARAAAYLRVRQQLADVLQALPMDTIPAA